MIDRTTHRPATDADGDFLRTMMAEAVNWRESPDFDGSILRKPELAHYLDGWKRPTDFGIVAERRGQPVGAAWARHFSSADPGYGYLDDGTPEVSIAVSAASRGEGLGAALLEALIDEARHRDLPAMSLSVEDGNRARGLYKKYGFTVVGRAGNSDTMVLVLA